MVGRGGLAGAPEKDEGEARCVPDSVVIGGSQCGLTVAS